MFLYLLLLQLDTLKRDASQMAKAGALHVKHEQGPARPSVFV